MLSKFKSCFDSSKSFSKKGFTLVELLIVIGILGILAIGLLAALDPVEQLRRGRDTSRMSVAKEVLGAMQRYYALQNAYPGVYDDTGAVAANNLSSIGGTFTDLITAGELKTGYNTTLPTTTTAGTHAVQVYKQSDVTGGNIIVCFDPESKGVSIDQQNTIYDNAAGATAGAGCPSTVGTNTCFWCAQ